MKQRLRSIGHAVTVVVICVLSSQLSLAQSPATTPPAVGDAQRQAGAPPESEEGVFGISPDDIARWLKDAQEAKEKKVKSLLPVDPLQPLHRLWDKANKPLEKIGLNLGLNYTQLYQFADTALPGRHQQAAGDDLDFFGRWSLVNRGGRWPGSVAFSSEVRHALMDVPPGLLGPEIGSVWGTVFGFGQQSFSLTELYWEQGSRKDRLIYRLGRMKVSNIYNRGRYTSANYGFESAGISDTPPMPVPGAGMGVAGVVYPTKDIYILAGIHDANGRSSTMGDIGAGEFFTALELGYRPRRGQTGEGLYHVTFWYSDAVNRKSQPSGRGFALHMEQEIGMDGRIVPFARYSYGAHGATPVRQLLALGVGFDEPFGQNKDIIGLAAVWGQPENRALRDQYGIEAFYRFCVTPYSHVTPGLQVIFNPAGNPYTNTILIGCIRLRTLF